MRGRAWLAAGLSLAAIGCTTNFVVLAPFDDDPPDAGATHDASPAPDPEDAGLDGGPHWDAELDAELSARPDAGDAGPRPAVPAIAALAHTCAESEGALYCWGAGSRGQFGAVGGAAEPQPVRLAEGDFVELCAAQQHTCALRSDQTLHCWGGNDAGQLGLGDTTPRGRPTALAGQRFASVACGGLATCAIALGGELYCWGDDSEGMLGQGGAPTSPPFSATPVRVARELRFRRVAVGQGHVCAIEQSGMSWCWGRNTLGQLGVASSALQLRAPTQVASAHAFSRIAAGMHHTCAINIDGRLSCWGDNGGEEDATPRLGIGVGMPGTNRPVLVGSDSDYAELSISWFHSCALKRGGSLFCWGRNVEGQLGLGDAVQRAVPTRVGGGSDWQRVSVGQFHTCGVRGGALYCWGDNDEGQLGLGDLAERYVPFAVSLPTSLR